MAFQVFVLNCVTTTLLTFWLLINILLWMRWECISTDQIFNPFMELSFTNIDVTALFLIRILTFLNIWVLFRIFRFIQIVEYWKKYKVHSFFAIFQAFPGQIHWNITFLRQSVYFVQFNKYITYIWWFVNDQFYLVQVYLFALFRVNNIMDSFSNLNNNPKIRSCASYSK